MTAPRLTVPIGPCLVLAGMVVLLTAGGCIQRPSGPEKRAAYFVEKMIYDPAALADLRAVAEFADSRGPDVFLDDLPARTALFYLRSRVRLGAELKIHASGSRTLAPERREVTVSVSEGLAIGATPAVQLQVELRRRDQDWMVVHLTSS